MTDIENKNDLTVDDEVLTEVSGGGIPYYTPSQYSLIGVSLQGAILKILAALQPNYGYSDVGANFMSLILDWGEYCLHVNGKNENDPKCIAIAAVLTAKGFDMEEIRRMFVEEAKRQFG